MTNHELITTKGAISEVVSSTQEDYFSAVPDPKKDPIKLEVQKTLQDGEMWKTMSPLAFKAN